MTTQTFLYNIRELIAKGNLKLALNQLRQLLKNSPKLDDALLQSARFSDLLNGIKLGVLDHETAHTTKNKINKGILDMLREIEEQEGQPAIYAEIQNAIRLSEEMDEYGRIKEKIYLNRGAGTSELLKDKRATDLEEKTLNRLFQTERVIRIFDEDNLNNEEITVQKRLVSLSLAENGHIFKGTFLCLGKRNQIQTICPSASPSQFIIFKGTNRTHIFQLESLEGHITQQYEEMMRLLRKNIPLGRNREKDEDIYEIPITAISEFIANAFVHRDYDFGVQSYIQVEMYDDRIEIKSPGHLPPSVNVNNIQGTVLTNPTIAAVFHLNGYIERAGTGINVAQRLLIEHGLERATIENIDSPKMVKVTIKRHFFSVNGDKKIVKYLGNPVFLPDFLIGREADLEAISTKLFKENNSILLINGVGGIGKTALAAVYYHRFSEKYAHLAWISAREGLLEGLLNLAKPLGLIFDETMTYDEKLSQLFEHLRQLPKPCLLVIDRAEDLDELNKHYAYLKSCPNFHILILSRLSPFAEKIPVYALSPLAENEAIALFKKHYPKNKETDNDIIKNINAIADNNPLIIQLLAINIAQFNRFKTQYSLNDLLIDLQQKGLLNFKNKTVTSDYPKGGEAQLVSIPDVIGAMYKLSQLTDNETNILKAISNFHSEPVDFSVLEKTMNDTEELEESVLNLAQKGWLMYDESNSSFKMHPIIQAIVQQKTMNKIG